MKRDERHPDLLTPEEAAERAGLKSPRTFIRWRAEVGAPRYMRNGNRTYYWRHEIDLALRLRAGHTSEADVEAMRERLEAVA
ncbi:MAG: hypothetical protein AAF916_04255 [Planctomycetota bacterium]